MTTTYVEKAARWWDVFETIKDRPTVGPLPGAESSSIEGSAHFAGATWDDAVRMMQYGWREGAERLSALLDGQAEATVRESQWSIEAAGHFPCVPAYLSGSPECMYALEEVETVRPRLCLVVPMNYPSSIDAEEVLRYGAAVAAIVRALEAAGNDVCVISMGKSESRDGGDTMVYPIIVRDFGEPLDLSIVAFAFHPAFLRRISFAWRERHPLAAKIGLARRGYGIPQPITEEDCRKALGDDMATLVVRMPAVHAVDPGLLWNDSALPRLVEMFREHVRKALAQQPSA